MKRAELFDGTVLEFPDDIADDVMDNVVRKETESRKTSSSPVTEPNYSPTEGVSDFENFAAGTGKGMMKLVDGFKQAMNSIGGLGGAVTADSSDPAAREAYKSEQAVRDSMQADIDEQKRLDAPLMKTGAGQAGDILGTIATALPAAFIPGANTYLGASAVGAGLGAIQPVASDESRGENTALGAAGGLGGQAAGRALASAFKGTKAIAEPFYKKGQEAITGRLMKSFSNNPDEAVKNLATAGPLVKGSQPTVAEVSKDAGLAQLQRSAQTTNPKFAGELTDRALDQNSARIAAMHEITKYGGNLDEALTRRAEAGAKLYEKAFGQQIVVDKSIKTLTERPSFQEALKRAQRIAEEEGNPIKNMFDQEAKFASTRALHYVKMGFDDLINDAPQAGIGKTELNAIKATRGKLLDWMSENNPSYKTARVRFEKMSRPINREEVSREIVSRATRNQMPNVRGETTLFPDAFARTLKDEGGAVVKATTGRAGKELPDVMTPEQMDILRNIRGDLSRNVTARDAGRSVGSNTAQNLAGQNLIRQFLGPLGVPESITGSTAASQVARGPGLFMKAGESGIQDTLSEALLDPKYGAELLRRALSGGKDLGKLVPFLPSAAGSGLAVGN